MTGWKCDECHAVGIVTHDRDVGLYEVLEKLQSSHARKSPACPWDLGKIRVEIHEGATSEAIW